MAESEPRRDGELVEAAFVGNEAEGEMIRGLLQGAGIPSILQAAGMFEGTRHGFGGVPVYGGAQKVMVHADRLEEARELIAATVADEAPDELS